MVPKSAGSLETPAQTSVSGVPIAEGKKISSDSVQQHWGDLKETKEDVRRCSWDLEDVNNVKTWRAGKKKSKSK